MKKILLSYSIYLFLLFIYFYIIYPHQCDYYWDIIFLISTIYILTYPIVPILLFANRDDLFWVKIGGHFFWHLLFVIICSNYADNYMLSKESTIIIPAKIIKKQAKGNGRGYISHQVYLKGKGLFDSVYVFPVGTNRREGELMYFCLGDECQSEHNFSLIARKFFYLKRLFIYQNNENIKFRTPDSCNLSKIHDFAFTGPNFEFFTYHDYSLLKPDFVYYKVGFNVIYNAVGGLVDKQDSTLMLCFNDVCGQYQNVKYSVKGYPTIPDTFLIYRNINEKIDTQWHICAPEVNTPENRAKISDYGYIFHYDVCSKHEIESQCPRIRDYVEQYKKRMSDNNTNTTESTAQEPE